MTQDISENPRPYHHGELRDTLIETGLALARTGGAKALGLREVTRAVGVSPSAAYRHFADQRALVVAVASKAQDLLARAMLTKMETLAQGDNPAELALARLRGVGLGYISFAILEPGWFELAFLTQDEQPEDPPTVTVEGKAPPPYQLLVDALNAMIHAGQLTPQQRVGAEWSCWSAVHGFADLATRGPLRGQSRSIIDQLAMQVVNTIIEGIQT